MTRFSFILNLLTCGYFYIFISYLNLTMPKMTHTIAFDLYPYVPHTLHQYIKLYLFLYFILE